MNERKREKKMKYVLYIDYMSGQNKEYSYKPMQSKNLLDAIMEAEQITGEDPLEIYLTRIMDFQGAVRKDDGRRLRIFKAVLCRRSYGWNLNTQKYGEGEHYAEEFKGEFTAFWNR